MLNIFKGHTIIIGMEDIMRIDFLGLKILVHSAHFCKLQLLKEWLKVVVIIIILGWLIGLSLVTHENSVRLNNIPNDKAFLKAQIKEILEDGQ